MLRASGAVCRRLGRPFPPTAEFAPSSRCIAGSACTPVEGKSITTFDPWRARHARLMHLRPATTATAGGTVAHCLSAGAPCPPPASQRRRPRCPLHRSRSKKFQSFSVSLGMKRLSRFYDSLRYNRSGRANRGGPGLRSVIYGGSLVAFPGSRHRSRVFPLHVLAGSRHTIFERSCLETQFPASPGRLHLAAVKSVLHPRRRQNSPRAPDASQVALAHQ